ncbi:MAG: hypothetical protein ABSG31_05260 [Tepidisphaeraceae bacterium]
MEFRQPAEYPAEFQSRVKGALVLELRPPVVAAVQLQRPVRGAVVEVRTSAAVAPPVFEAVQLFWVERPRAWAAVEPFWVAEQPVAVGAERPVAGEWSRMERHSAAAVLGDPAFWAAGLAPLAAAPWADRRAESRRAAGNSARSSAPAAFAGRDYSVRVLSC